MYEDAQTTIKDIFTNLTIDETHDKDLDVYPHPLGEGVHPDSYPALVFYPDDYENRYSSTKANKKTLKYKAILMIKAEGIDNETLYMHTLPRTADKVLEKLDKEWDGGFIDDQNRRVWITTDVAYFGVDEGADGKIAFLNMDILLEFQFEI